MGRPGGDGLIIPWYWFDSDRPRSHEGTLSGAETVTSTPAWLSVCIAVGAKESPSRLLATLDSVASQVGARVELVLKTAGDQLSGTIEEYRKFHPNERIRLQMGPDQGTYDAFNTCVASATGQYVLFLGCGDQLADAAVAADLQRDAMSLGTPDVLYGHVILSDGSAKSSGRFSTDCFSGRRARLPWRNPCHSQGLAYRREWLARHPFRTDVGPLADLVHTYQYRVFDRARWIERPIAIFRTDGMSYAMDVASLAARLRGVRANCENFRFPAGWKLLSSLVYLAQFARHRVTKPRGRA
jgi:glycosyltransferase involved in cell wall biosynthesis